MKLNTLEWLPPVVAVILFLAAAFFTQANGRRVLSALICGALASALGLFLDVFGYWTDLWHYEGAHISHGPWLVYVAVAFVQGAVALIAWHLLRRFHVATVVIFVVFVASVLTSQDYVIAASHFRIQIISPGIAPAIYDFLLWLLVTTVSVWTLRALAGSPRPKVDEPS